MWFCDPSTWEAKMEHHELLARPGYKVRKCSKESNKKTKESGCNNLHFDISLSCRPLGNMVEVNDMYVPLFG